MAAATEVTAVAADEEVVEVAAGAAAELGSTAMAGEGDGII